MSRAPSSPTRALKISPGDLVVWNSYQVTGRISEGHLRAGTRVEAVKRWKEATSYVERYMAKPEEFPEGLETGRIWGFGMRTYYPFVGRRSRSTSETPSGSGGYTESWRGGRVAGPYAV
jgi:hypothetical protein